MKTCSFETCDALPESRGYCGGHYTQIRRGKALTAIARYATVEARFWSNVQKSGGCWQWTAKVRTGSGYGVMSLGSKDAGEEYAHRYSYELASGPIPAGMAIDHKCHNRLCVNPAHLRLATSKHNNENRSGANSNSASGIRCVYPLKDTGKWIVQVTHHRRRYHGGIYDTTAQAEAAAIALRLDLFTHNDLDRVTASSVRPSYSEAATKC